MRIMLISPLGSQAMKRCTFGSQFTDQVLSFKKRQAAEREHDSKRP
ncbi:hypothetical protein [Yoonia sediminilitoris]|nr:hypothetical protein [Yoonia sediminilitoris]